MYYSCILPVLGSFVASYLIAHKQFKKEKQVKVVSVSSEDPVIQIKEDLVKTSSGVIFKVISLQGRSVAGKKNDELEADLNKVRIFFQRICEYDVELRVYTERFEKESLAKAISGNEFIDEINKRWESRLEKTFETKHYIAVSAEDESKLEQIEKVIKEAMSLLSLMEPKVLIDKEIDRFISTFYNPEERKYRIDSSITILKTGEIVFDTDGSLRTRLIFGIKDFGSSVSGQMVESLLALPYSMIVMTHIKPMSKAQALADIKSRNIQANFNKGFEFRSDKFEQIRTLIEDDAETLLVSEMTIHLNLKNTDNKEQAIKDIIGCLGTFETRPVLERQFAMPMFWSQCPGRDLFNRELRLTSSNLGDLHPLIRSETGFDKCDWGNAPVCRFPTAPAGNPFGFTFHASMEDQAPPHCVVFAPTGSGKSVLILHLITQALAAYPDLSIYALDRDNGLTVYTEMVGGTYHDLKQDGNIKINPFNCSNQIDETNLNLFMQILTNALSDEEKKDIRTFISEMLRQPEHGRTMAIYANELIRAGKFKEKLEPWIKGNTLNAKLFNGEVDTLDIEQNRLNVFGVDGLRDDPNASAAFFFYLFKRIEMNAKKGKPSLLIIDEAPTLLSSPALKSEIEKLLKTARKQRMAIFMAFQGVGDLNQLGLKETILTNCHTRFFYSGAASVMKELDGFNLTESESDFLLSKGKKIKGAERPILMQRNGTNVFFDTDMSCLGEYLNAYKGGAKTIKKMEFAKKYAPDNWIKYYLNNYSKEN